MTERFVWTRGAVTPELAAMLTVLGEEYPLFESGDGVGLEFVPGADGVSRAYSSCRGAIIEYGSLTCAARALGALLSGTESAETLPFDTFGIMLDASRNGVMTVEHFKKWLRRLALMGYNMAMLYTEDTYKLPDEPYFGYMRGAYSFAELREIDDYAASLGIEMVACFQTLGHMEQILKWIGVYPEATDTARVMNVGEEATYGLIAKMLDFWSEVFRSRRVHIGMDETHDLGRGRFLDKYGYTNGFELFNRHLTRVKALCDERELSPMIWSDMYFRLGNADQNYYDLNSNIPADVRAKIPEDVTLVYWDYYHSDYQFYHDFIKLHQELNRPVALGSGVWTWSKMWYDHNKTKASVEPGIRACRDTGVKEVFFTMWGDDGAYCAFDSAFTGLAFAAEVAYGDSSESAAAARYSAICGGDYAASVLAGDLDISSGDEDRPFICSRLLWDDPVMGMVWNCYNIIRKDFDQSIIAVYDGICAGLADKRDGDGCADLNHPYLIAETVARKLRFRRELLRLYRSGDRGGIAELAAEIPGIIECYTAVADSFRAMWLSTFKTYGLEVIQIRNAGQIARWNELTRRMLEYSAGACQNIPELDEQLNTDMPSLAIWVRGAQTSTYWF